jgi:23S rRNA (uracil1939-C5)-methyltransferase
LKAENKRIIIEAFSSAYGAFSLGRYDGKIVLIKGIIPKEKAEVIITEERKDYLTAQAFKILEPSPDRVNPPCEYFNNCGGCQLQYIKYERQIKVKEEILLDCLKRIGHIEISLSEPLFENTWNYRHRGQFKISRGLIGFYKERSIDVVDIKKCLIMKEEINEYLRRVRDGFLNKENSALSEIAITYGNSAIVSVKYSGNSPERIAKILLDIGFSGVVIDLNKRYLSFKNKYTVFGLDSLMYALSPMSFLQSHWRLNQSVVRFIKNNLKPLKGLRVLDLYAGAGNFSLPLFDEADEIVGIEENPFAIEDGRKNLELNRIKNYRFIHSSVETYDFVEPFDVFIIDPPRAGLSNRVVDKILGLSKLPERIVYMSCNPTTLSRDLRKLSLKYMIESVRLIDFFPQTYHVEALVFLRLG